MLIRKPSENMVYFKSAALVALLAIYVTNAKTEGDFRGVDPGERGPGGPGGRHGDGHDGAKDFVNIAWESEIDVSRPRLLRSMKMATKNIQSY
jgi:hypothetical protein